MSQSNPILDVEIKINVPPVGPMPPKSTIESWLDGYLSQGWKCRKNALGIYL